MLDVDFYRQKILSSTIELDCKYPGVTRVLGGTKDTTWLDAWRDRVGHEQADRIVQESKRIGTSLDTIFNESLENRNSFDQSLWKHQEGFRLYRQLKPYIQKIEPICVQKKVWSHNLKMMGYLDCLGIYNGKITLIDCKNSKRQKLEEHLLDYYLQTTAYSLMIWDMYGIRVEQIGLLIARRDQPFPQIIFRDYRPYIKEVINRSKSYYVKISSEENK